MNEQALSEGPLTPEQLKDLYRGARDPVLRAHLHIVWRSSLGEPLRQVAEVSGYATKWVKEILRRYQERGVEGLGDRRRHRNPGAAERALLDAAQREELLREALKRPPPDGGLWSGPKVALWMAQKTARRRVRAQRSWDYLKKLGHTPQVPPGPHTPRPTPKSKRPSKKVARAGEGSTGGPPRSAGGAVGREDEMRVGA